MTPSIDPQKLLRLNRAVPRYTSYPTIPEWSAINEEVYRAHLFQLGQKKAPVSLYLHIPFCRTMCLYCACSVVLNRKSENEERYVHSLCKEIELVFRATGTPLLVKQLHFGGGTPTQLSIEQLTKIFEQLHRCFQIDPNAEISIEIDPRTVIMDKGEKLSSLKKLGFNRISFGVQDTDPKVQEAVKRRQSYEVTRTTYLLARSLNFEEINIDLIYGLPYQTQTSFAKTVEQIIELRPNRIALFSYAKVPWLKPHQKAIAEETLPSTEEKFSIYAQARHQFLAAGYVAIGMDHFALENDSITQAFRTHSLQRNFQGYSLKLAENLIGFGVTATGLVENGYFQNKKELSDYYADIESGHLPLLRGKVLSQDDLIRKWVIHRLMCDFVLYKKDFALQFGFDFDTYFKHEQAALIELAHEDLLLLHNDRLEPTFYGSLLIRNIASTFDAYLQRHATEGRFSKAV